MTIPEVFSLGYQPPRPGIKVYFLDAWKTIARGPYAEPIFELRQILGLQHVQDEEFLRVCLTTPHDEESAYLNSVAARYGVTPTEDALSKFKKLVRTERNGLLIYDDVAETLRTLRNAGFKVGLITNSWPFPIRKMLAASGLESLFDRVFISAEVQIAKQDGPSIYQHAAAAFGVSTDECCMVGDNPALDILPALQAGCEAVLIDRYEQYTDEQGQLTDSNLRSLPIRAIRCLSELPKPR